MSVSHLFTASDAGYVNHIAEQEDSVANVVICPPTTIKTPELSTRPSREKISCLIHGPGHSSEKCTVIAEQRKIYLARKSIK